MTADYSSQILALSAAASIHADGSTPVTYGCSITRIATGSYALILPTGEGLIDEQSFTTATPKAALVALNVSDDANGYFKYINSVSLSDGTTATDAAIEVIVHRATVNPY
jgi:hypothetical protein